MKGTLNKHEEGWLVTYGYMQFLPLHPDFIEMMDTCFTSKFKQVVEFEIVTEWENGEVGVNGLTYAKLIHHSVEPNEMIDHIGDANKMVDQVPDVRKMVEEYGDTCNQLYKEWLKLGFEAGYNKAKETLYTEEQVREAIELARGIKDDEMTFDISSITGCGEMCTYGWKEEYSSDEIIKSLKQPKQ